MMTSPNEPILDGVDARVKSREIVDPSQHLSINRKHLVGQEIKGKRLKSFVVVESHLEGCRFEDIRSDDACFGAGRKPSTFIECSFSNVRLRSITAGIARFERCRFERIDFREMFCFAVDFVDCTFRGKIAKAVIAAHPMGGPYPLKERNEIVGNDFSKADLIDVAFRGGVDLEQQVLPHGPPYIFLRDAGATLRRAREELLRIPNADVRHEAILVINGMLDRVTKGQTQMLLRTDELVTYGHLAGKALGAAVEAALASQTE